MAVTRELIVVFDGVDVLLGGRPILSDITWSLGAGEHWAVLGANGSGKSTFLKLIKGDVWPAQGRPGSRRYFHEGRETRSLAGVSRAFGLVSPDLQALYLAGEWDVPALEIVMTGYTGGLRLYEEPPAGWRESALAMLELHGAGHLRDKPLHAMSMGEGRKVLLCRALVARPRVLLLDECAEGLDAASRRTLLAAVEQVAREGTGVVMATHRPEEIIPSITHVLRLDAGRISACGGRDEVLSGLRRSGPTPVRPDPEPPVPPARRASMQDVPFLVRVERATVTYQGKKALDDVSWEVLPGESWAVSGRNGSGKSTLLKLILGDLYPLPGGSVLRFGGEKLTITELKTRIGLVSADIQVGYRHDVTALQAVQSGLHASIGLWREVSDDERQQAEEWLGFLGLAEFAGQPIKTLSQGQFRRVLIARAMVTRPGLLLLDEPLTGLDRDSSREFVHFLRMLMDGGVSVLYVTHHPDEIAGLPMHELHLDKGRIAEIRRLTSECRALG